jgi:hypothetical protein
METAYRRSILGVISVTVLVLTIVRCPELLIHPRFFAEEGTTYFSSAYRTSFLANIFSAHYGYYTLYNQLATSLATLVPLEHAPLVTTLMALLVQVGVSLYLLWGDLPLLQSLPRRVVLALALPLIAWPGHWLTVIGSQCWLAAGTFLLLISGAGGTGRVRVVRGACLLVAGLTGVVSCFMTPAFFLRGVREKSKEFLLYGGVLAACLPVHAVVLCQAYRSGSAEIACRFEPNVSAMTSKTLVYLFAVPFTGRSVYAHPLLVEFGAGVKRVIAAVCGLDFLVYDLFVVPLLIGGVVLALVTVMIVRNRTRTEVQTMTLALVTVTALSNICSVNGVGGPRYYFLPSLILLTLLLGCRVTGRLRPVALLAGLLVATTLLGNGYEYRSIMAQQAYHPSYPDWHEEVRAWRSCPSHQISIWPASWKMNLERRLAGPGARDGYS